MIASSFADLRFGSALALLALAAACGGHHRAPAGGGNAGDGGNGGEEPDSPGGAGTTQAGGSAAAGPGSGEAQVQPGEHCIKDADCDDGLFCNGRELCKAQADSDFKLCEVPELGPCVAQNCDEASRRCDCSDAEADHDGDGFKTAGCVSGNEKPDCDDDDATRFPGAAEECAPADPTHDEDCNPETIAGAGKNGDEDGDHFVSSTCANFLSYQLSRHPGAERRKNSGRDCDDNADSGAKVHPGAEEVCDGIDNNCNGVPDETTGVPLDKLTPYYRDADGDAFGSDREEDILWSQCNAAPPGYVTIHGDCDDTNRYVAPSRSEVCNGIDDDCDDIIDQPVKAGTLLSGEPYDGVTQFECLNVDGWHVKDGGCPENRLDCDGLYLNACEVPATTLCNCHACDTDCKFSCGRTGCEEVQGGSTGVGHTCFLVAPKDKDKDNASSVACAGRNASGQLGNGTFEDSVIPTPVSLPERVTSVTSGAYHSCALGISGRLYCWGENDSQRLGASRIESQVNFPVEVAPFGVFDLGGTKQVLAAMSVVAGFDFTCAIYQGGRVACWGKGDWGQLGDRGSGIGHHEAQPVPVLVDNVPLVGASQLAAGTFHACALIDGTVKCWGTNDSMQIGLPLDAVELSAEPVVVPGLENVHVDEIAIAGAHSCARASGRVFCWGANDLYQLANSDDEVGAVTEISLPEGAKSIIAGAEFTCALTYSQRVLCWGSNQFGERGVMNAPIEPNFLPLENVSKVFGGQGSHLCALKGVSALCLGKNDRGQLANGTTASSTAATQVEPLVKSQRCTE